MDDVNLKTITAAETKLQKIIKPTPLQYSERLSQKYNANIYLKREDLQPVRSYKIRGAYNAVANLTDAQRASGVVCASAGNHAQGVAYACARMNILATIYMPETTPAQKVNRVRYFGNSHVTIVLTGATYDEAAAAAHEFAEENGAYFVHPFNDPLTISGQGTVAMEVLRQIDKAPDAVVVPVGGGGLLAGTTVAVKAKLPSCKVYGVEPEGAASMAAALQAGKPVKLTTLDTFVDGASVGTVGEYGQAIAKKYDVELLAVSSGRLCKEMVDLYQNDGIITEPAGALSITALGVMPDKIKGKTVVCVVSGGNNDLSRYPEIVERSLIFQGLKHYFLIQFSQRPGQLRSFVDNALGPTDDIVRFEYTKKNNKESGPALVGIELARKEDLDPLLRRMRKVGITYQKVINDELLFSFLV